MLNVLCKLGNSFNQYQVRVIRIVQIIVACVDAAEITAEPADITPFQLPVQLQCGQPIFLVDDFVRRSGYRFTVGRRQLEITGRISSFYNAQRV